MSDTEPARAGEKVRSTGVAATDCREQEQGSDRRQKNFFFMINFTQ